MNTDYDALTAMLLALTDGEPDELANLANAAALLFETLEDINWAGFYRLDGDELVLGPFQGRPACVRIPLGKGVCGLAAADDETKIVTDVHQFEGHIACDSRSNSEIVIPLHRDGRVWGVMDIDSPSVGRFDEHDGAGLGDFAAALESAVLDP